MFHLGCLTLKNEVEVEVCPKIFVYQRDLIEFLYTILTLRYKNHSVPVIPMLSTFI